MQNIDVRFNATSNFAKVKADLAALNAQAAALGDVFERNAYAKPPAVVDTAAWRNASRAVHEASNVYRAAASSSGLLTTQQIRATSEAERYTKALQKQKLTFGEMRKHSGIMKQVYADQLRFQRMTAQYWGTDSAGRAITDITIPKNVPRDLDTVAQKLYFTGQMAASASTQIVNMGKNMQWAGRQLTVGFTYPMALFGVAAGMTAYKVDEAMTRVTKVYDVSAEAQNNEAMRAKELAKVRVDSIKMAEKAAREYGMSVNDTLEIEQQLAATGLSGNALFGATKETARIATLGDLNIDDAVQTTITLQNAFRSTIKTTEDLTRTFNFMNAVENATSLDLISISEAAPRAAAGLAGLGVTAEEMTVMLVAMKEAGVDAAEGANALKSATTRILNPVNKAKQYYDQYGISLENISKESGGNLFEFLKMLSVEQRKITGSTIKETNRLRQKGVATLFGTYQFNRLNAALVNVGDSMAGYGSQTSQATKAVELMTANNKELAKSAETELGEKMEAVSGRFKAAWEVVRIELYKAGLPFLEVATYAAEAAGSTLEFFNEMPSWKKKAVMGAAAVMALAGPVVMLGGLFMNLGGQFASGIGRILSGVGKLGGAFGLVAKEEKAASLSAQAQNDAMMRQQKTTATLAQEINVLTKSYERATAAARMYADTQGIASGTQMAASGTVASASRAKTWKPETQQQAFLGMPGGTAAAAYAQPARETARAYENAADKAQMLAATERQRLNSQVSNSRAALAESKIRDNIENKVTGASVGMAAMGVAMGGMMLTNNQFVNDLSKWLLIGTIVVPAVKILGQSIAVASKSAWSMAAAQIAAARAARANAIATGAAAGRFGTLKAGASGLASSLATTLGPGGVITIGLMAIGGAYYWAWNKGKEAREEAAAAYRKQTDLAKSVESSTRRWAENMGIVVGKYQRVSDISSDIISGKPAGDKAASEQSQLIDYYKKNPKGKADSPVDEFTSMYGDINGARASMALVQKYIDLQAEAKLSSADAAKNMRAFFIAAGESADTADGKTQELVDKWGSIKSDDFNWVGFVDQQMSMFRAAAPAEAGVAGKDAAEAFWAGMVSERNPEQAQKLLDNFVGGTQNNISDVWTSLGNKYGRGWYSMMEDQGVTNVKQFAEFLRRTSMEELSNMDWSREDKMSKTMVPGYGMVEKPDGYKLPWREIKMAIEDANREQDTLLSGLDKVLNFGDDVGSVFDLQDYSRVSALTMTYGEQRDIVKDMMAEFDANRGNLSKDIRAQREATIKAFLLANGYKLGANYSENMFNFMNQVGRTTVRAADEAARLKNNINGINNQRIDITLTQAGDIARQARGAVQADMVESAMAKFNNNWESREQALQNSWESRSEALQARHDKEQRALEASQERAQRAFENRWERRKDAINKAYDARIKAVENEIAAEQKADEVRANLFEKEKNRLARLAELQNTDIDFNTQLNEGNLDEAAKTLNNAGVSDGNAQMDAEQAAAEARTAARVEALEKKNERLEAQRDKEVSNLEKMEERMRRHLERIQDARRRALEKHHADEMKSIKRAEDAAMASMRRQRNYEEAILKQRLDLFKSYTGRNQRDLERWMRKVGLTYDDFGTDVKAKGKSWSEYFQRSLSAHIRKAGMEVREDNAWQGIGQGIANKLLKGMGFSDMAQFNRFVRTGVKSDGKKPSVETRHEGGVVGTGGGSRGSIPNTYKGLHRTEKMIRAQKGEYVINKKSAKENMGVLDAINKGSDISGVMGGAADGYGGPAGLLAGALAKMFTMGTEKAFNNNYEVGLRKQMKSAPGLFSGTAGAYGGRVFSAEQMKNAAIIASVGSSMGLSARDLQIGIMTAIAESGLINVNFGDRDSLGLFQQRPSMGWGSPSQVTNPRYASAKFFSALKAHSERGEETPWMAAQHVQRSAFADGSNYRAWWAAAQAIYGKGLVKTPNGGFGVGGGFVPGKGGRHRPINAPVTSGLHGGNSYGNPPAVDMAVPSGKPIYAVADGTIAQSRDIAGPLSSDRYRGDGPYGSFGRMIMLDTDSGAGVLYAHLSRRSVATGQRVKGGSVIGYSGNTGNSSGPHLHFGATNGPYAWLRRGGKIRHDNTPVIAHKGETMLSERLTKRFEQSVGGGGGDTFHVTLDLRGAMIKEDVDIKRAVNAAIDERENKVGRKRVVK